MNILQTAEPLLAVAALAVPEERPEAKKFIPYVCTVREQVLKNLRFLALTEESRANADFLLTVYTDEMMLQGYPEWPLLQLKNFQTNRGGEEFFVRLNDLLKISENSDCLDESIALLELCGMLLALGFTGKYWSDKTGAILKLRRKINERLGLSGNSSLCNTVSGKPERLRISYLDKGTVFLMIIMLLGILFCALLLSDFMALHQELWVEVGNKLLNGGQ